MNKKLLMVAALPLMGGHSAFAKVHRSELTPKDAIPAKTVDWTGTKDNTQKPEFKGGFNNLLPFVTRVPNQEDAGSCLYMAHTGIAEWWLARLNPGLSREAEGALDLSERFMMNIAGIEEDESSVENWKTDTIYLFNQTGYSLKNAFYPFTKGWYKRSPEGETFASEESVEGAEYGAFFNWIDMRPQPDLKGQVKLPRFERQVLFADPESNQWNIGITPDGIVEKVKKAIRENQAPVLVVYNQNAYWHAVYLAGYNDHADNGNCSYVESFRTRIQERAQRLQDSLDQAETPAERRYYEPRAARAWEAAEKIEVAYREGGGCTSSKGVFYIRDSIYTDENGPIYNYATADAADDAPYAKKIVLKSYDWLRYFANHIVQIQPVSGETQD